jgi:hypothetical protein
MSGMRLGSGGLAAEEIRKLFCNSSFEKRFADKI